MLSHGYCDQAIGTLGSVEGWKTLPIQECGEKLVPLGAFSEYPQILTDAIYVGERISSPYPCAQLRQALFTVFVREGVATRLAEAAKLLPEGCMFLVWDAYRPLVVQGALFDFYVDVLTKRGVSPEQARVDAQQFVSIPSEDTTRPPPHSTGGAVDLTIIQFSDVSAWKEMERLTQIVQAPESQANWKEVYAAEMLRLQLVRKQSQPLEMGTVFDGVHPETATRYFEDADIDQLDHFAQQCLTNRRLLWGVMNAVGLSNYPEEWWHFDFGNQFDAARTGRPAVYGGAQLSPENLEWECMRRDHYLGSVSLSQRWLLGLIDKLGGLTGGMYYTVARDLAIQTGSLSFTVHPQAAAL